MLAKEKKQPKIIGNYNESESGAPSFSDYGTRRKDADVVKKQPSIVNVSLEQKRIPAGQLPDMKVPLKKRAR